MGFQDEEHSVSWICMCLQVDEEYPGERVMMTQAIAISLFHNDTLLIKSPDPYMDIVVGGTDGRKSLGNRKYSFKARGVTPNVTVGDYFVVRDRLHKAMLFYWSLGVVRVWVYGYVWGLGKIYIQSVRPCCSPCLTHFCIMR